MPDMITKEQAEQLLRAFDQEAQTVAQDMQKLVGDAKSLGDSQQVFFTALGPAGADIDDDSLAAVAGMSVATSAVREEAGTVGRHGGETVAQSGAALKSLGAHTRLAEEIGAHPGAGKMGFYRPA